MTDKSVNTRQCYPSHGGAVLASPKWPFSCLLALVLLWVSGCQEKVKFAESGRSGPVVVLGDSLAEGYLAPPEASFPSVLEERLEIELVNLGQRGATTADSVPRVKEEVLPLEPALVVLELGGNDALQKVDPEVTRANFQTMIDELHGAGVPILLLGVRGGLFKDKFADLYPELAEENGLAYVPDILDGILTSPTLRVDNVHPNAAGHQKIADKVEPELRRLLEQIR